MKIFQSISVSQARTPPETYFIRLAPDGQGSIFVTLGILTWENVGIAEWSPLIGWSVTADATFGPAGPDASDEFPVWVLNQGGLR